MGTRDRPRGWQGFPWTRPVAGTVLALALGLGITPPVQAQYFGRNKVRYDRFDFRVLSTPHFDIHFDAPTGPLIEDVARMAERWYERFARLFQHEFEQRKPLILYADHPDFQQTNTLQGFLGESTGGVTESLKNRVIMPMTGSYQDTDHVLGHELVHAFQYNLAQSGLGLGMQGLARLPGWLVEGMSEYLSVGRDDPLTAMWLRDAVRRNDIPTIAQMNREVRYFPYRFGQALWAYIAGVYGDDAVVEIYRAALRLGWEGALESVLGIRPDSLSLAWAEAVRTEYLPLMEGRTPPSEVGRLILAPSTGAGTQNLAPSLSPDGTRLVFMSEKGLFSFDLYLADARTGRILRTLASSNADPHFDALRFIDSSGAWSWDGSLLAYVVFAGGDNQLVVADAQSGRIRRQIRVRELGAMQGPSWSPDNKKLVFSGTRNGITDLYLYDLDTGTTTRLTDDWYADFQPTFSPDGKTVAFITDRSEFTDRERLTYAKFQLGLLDLESGKIRTLSLFGPRVKHINPQFSPDGKDIYFLSDPDGFSDVYRYRLETGALERVTRVATAVSGITWSSPAMSVAQRDGRMAFSVFDGFEFHIYTLEPSELDSLARPEEVGPPGPGRWLPPSQTRVPSRVMAYLDDPDTGLVPPGTYTVADALPFRSRLQLDFIGQPTVGVGTDAFGNYIGGGTSAYFSDMLGDRILGVAVSAQGTLKDVGGQLFYLNQTRRWNWGYAAGRIPFQYLFYGFDRVRDAGSGVTYNAYVETRYRIFLDNFSTLLALPFSQTRRLEGTLGYTRYSYDIEQDQYLYLGNTLVDIRRVQRDELEPDPLNLLEGSVALVGDRSFAAFTSPVRGERYRLELGFTRGSARFETLLADYRRYFNPTLNLTLAFRGLHMGRYRYSSFLVNSNYIRPLFLGYETLIRGYSWESFDARECGETPDGSCPVFDRLFGQRLAVANAEIRVPFLGTDQFGLVNLPYVPVELVAFADAGIAWDNENPIDSWKIQRSATGRIPLFSTGLSARANILGMLILEIYYAYPWQRPQKGWHWGFNLAPGW